MGRLRMWLFTAGLALLLTGVVFVPIALAGETHVIARAASEGIGFTAAYTEYDYTAPAAFLVSGVVAVGMAFAARRR